LDRGLRLGREQGLVPCQDGGVALRYGNLDTWESLTYTGHAADVVAVSVCQGYSAELLPKLLHPRCDVIGRGGHRAVDQREPVFLLDQETVHGKHQRIPGQLNQVGAMAGDLHSLCPAGPGLASSHMREARLLPHCRRATDQVIAGTLGSSAIAASIRVCESST